MIFVIYFNAVFMVNIIISNVHFSSEKVVFLERESTGQTRFAFILSKEVHR
jgi:hypothetical protein